MPQNWMKWEKKTCGGGEIQGEKPFQCSQHPRLTLFVAKSNCAFCLLFTTILCSSHPHPWKNSLSQVSLIGVLLQFLCPLQWLPPRGSILRHLVSSPSFWVSNNPLSIINVPTPMEWIPNLVRNWRVTLDYVFPFSSLNPPKPVESYSTISL